MKTTIQTPNRFQALKDFPPLTYSMAAETPSSKLQKSPTIPTSQNASSANTQYFLKPVVENLFITSFSETPDFKALQNLIQRVMPSGCHWLPDDPQKTQTFYELILVDSNSVEISHTKDQKNPQRVAYSKCIIKQVLKSTEWASIWTTKEFSVNFIPKGYTYQDYRMAWYRTFFKRPFDHSWFFIFHQNCLKDFPIWFYEWWINFGSLPDILPPIPKLGFQTWVKKMTDPSYAIPIQFYAELRVPWIFCWSYKIDRVYSKEFPMSLIREFKIKWWTAYSVELCSQEAVLQFIQNRHLLQRSIQQLSKGASSSTQTPAPATPSPLKPDSSTSKITTVAANDTDEAAQFQEFLRFKAFQQQLKQQSTHSPTSSQDSSTEPLGTDPIGGQDPFDF